MADSGAPEDRPKRQEPPPLEFLRPGDQPPPPSSQPPAAWVPRPEDFQRPTYYQPPAARPAGGNRGTVAGALLILAGLIGFFWTFTLFLIPLTLSDAYTIINWTTEELAFNAIINTALIYAQVLAVLGGIMSLQRKNWKLAVVCATLGLLNFGFFFLGSVFAALGLLLLLGARPEFAS
ncbi:MAG TPA: hypothetical protein VIB49_04095 [Thermoplasmata archaeon]